MEGWEKKVSIFFLMLVLVGCSFSVDNGGFDIGAA